MLDIAIIIPELAKYGGAERYVIECVRRWQYSHKITLYATKFDQGFLDDHGVGSGVDRVTISPYFEGEHAMLLNAVLLPKLWEGEIGRHEVYHTHLWPTHLIDLHPSVWFPHEPLRSLYDLRHNQSVEGFASADSMNVHVYPKYNYDNIQGGLYASYAKCMELFDGLGRPDRIVANSRYTSEYLRSVYGRDIPDIVYPGVNVDEFMHVDRSENMVLAIGQLWPHKRTRLIIEAMPYVEEMQLYIVGSGPERQKLTTMTERLGLSDRVFFLDGVTNLEVQILFSRCLAVVFVPMREPFGIVALEAMAAGKPLIAVDEGGFTEVIDENCAFLVQPRPLEIAEKLNFLRHNRDIAQSMGKAGIEKAKGYTWDATAGQLIDIIEDTCREWHSLQPPEPHHESDREPMLFGIQYYCWYGEGLGSLHWNDNAEFGGITDMPLLGHYASSHGSTITEHLLQIEEAGIDFMILNLHVDGNGVNRYELAAMENIFEIASRVGTSLRFAIQLCLFDHHNGTLEPLLETLKRQFVANRHYLRVKGKPVLFLFWTGVLDGNARTIGFLDGITAGFFRIASSLRLYAPLNEPKRTFHLFDAFSLYSPLELSFKDSWERVWQEAYNASGMGNTGLRIATLSPGYDDAHLDSIDRKGNIHRRIPRADGETFGRMARFILDQEEAPDMVILSTFNEFHENTHIEPSVKFGSRYLDLTREFITEGRAKWENR